MDVKPQAATLSHGLSPNLKRLLMSIGALAVLFTTFAILRGSLFLAQTNLINIVHQVVTYALVGYGLTYCLVSGSTDLSAGASLAVSGIVVVLLLQRGMPLSVAISLALLTGIVMGLCNGVSVMILGVMPFIATLGTQWVFRGVANVVVGGQPVYTTEIQDAATREWFYIFGGGKISPAFPIPWSVIIALVYGGILFFILAKTSIGRKIYACGSNMEAARLSGINVKRVRIFAYCVSGFSAAVAGILMSSRISSGQPAAGFGYEMEAIAASVLGGVAISGGEGGIHNTIVGALIMGVLRNGLNLCGVNMYWQMVVIGGIIVLACAAEAARNRKYS